MWAGVVKGMGTGGRRMERKTEVQLFKLSFQKPSGLFTYPEPPILVAAHVHLHEAKTICRESNGISASVCLIGQSLLHRTGLFHQSRICYTSVFLFCLAYSPTREKEVSSGGPDLQLEHNTFAQPCRPLT